MRELLGNCATMRVPQNSATSGACLGEQRTQICCEPGNIVGSRKVLASTVPPEVRYNQLKAVLQLLGQRIECVFRKNGTAVSLTDGQQFR